MFCWHAACLALRAAQGRPLTARFGKRTLVVCDSPWVHQVNRVARESAGRRSIHTRFEFPSMLKLKKMTT